MPKFAPMKNKKTIKTSVEQDQDNFQASRREIKKAAKLLKKSRQSAKDHKYREIED
jgi:hypothetical protein